MSRVGWKPWTAVDVTNQKAHKGDRWYGVKAFLQEKRDKWLVWRNEHIHRESDPAQVPKPEGDSKNWHREEWTQNCLHWMSQDLSIDDNQQNALQALDHLNAVIEQEGAPHESVVDCLTRYLTDYRANQLQQLRKNCESLSEKCRVGLVNHAPESKQTWLDLIHTGCNKRLMLEKRFGWHSLDSLPLTKAKPVRVGVQLREANSDKSSERQPDSSLPKSGERSLAKTPSASDGPYPLGPPKDNDLSSSSLDEESTDQSDHGELYDNEQLAAQLAADKPASLNDEGPQTIEKDAPSPGREGLPDVASVKTATIEDGDDTGIPDGSAVNFVEEETVDSFLNRFGVEARDNSPDATARKSTSLSDIEDVLNELETQRLAEISRWPSPVALFDDDIYIAKELPNETFPMKPLPRESKTPTPASTASATSESPKRKQRTLQRTNRLPDGVGLRTARRSRQAPAAAVQSSVPSATRPAPLQPAILSETDAEALRKAEEVEAQRAIGEIVNLSPKERSQAATAHLLGANSPRFIFAYLNILADPDLDGFRADSIRDAISSKPPNEANLVRFKNVIATFKERRENWEEEILDSKKLPRIDAMLEEGDKLVDEWSKRVELGDRLDGPGKDVGTQEYNLILWELRSLNLPPPRSQIAPPVPRRARRQPTAWPPKT
jgi:hypothetical protein